MTSAAGRPATTSARKSDAALRDLQLEARVGRAAGERTLAGVEHDHRLGTRRLVQLLHHQAPGTRRAAPVHAAQRLAGRVIAHPAQVEPVRRRVRPAAARRIGPVGGRGQLHHTRQDEHRLAAAFQPDATAGEAEDVADDELGVVEPVPAPWRRGRPPATRERTTAPLQRAAVPAQAGAAIDHGERDRAREQAGVERDLDAQRLALDVLARSGARERTRPSGEQHDADAEQRDDKEAERDDVPLADPERPRRAVEAGRDHQRETPPRGQQPHAQTGTGVRASASATASPGATPSARPRGESRRR